MKRVFALAVVLLVASGASPPAYKIVPVENGGWIAGRIGYVGPRGERKEIMPTVDAPVCGQHGMIPSDELVVSKAGGLQYARSHRPWGCNPACVRKSRYRLQTPSARHPCPPDADQQRTVEIETGARCARSPDSRVRAEALAARSALPIPAMTFAQEYLLFSSVCKGCDTPVQPIRSCVDRLASA